MSKIKKLKKPVKPRQRACKNGNISLYLDMFYKSNKTPETKKIKELVESRQKHKNRFTSLYPNIYHKGNQNNFTPIPWNKLIGLFSIKIIRVYCNRVYEVATSDVVS